MYSSYSFTILALNGGEWSAFRPGRTLSPGRTPVPIVQEAWWASEAVRTEGLEEKSFSLWRRSNLNRPVVQSVVGGLLYWSQYPNGFRVARSGLCTVMGVRATIDLYLLPRLMRVLPPCPLCAFMAGQWDTVSFVAYRICSAASVSAEKECHSLPTESSFNTSSFLSMSFWLSECQAIFHFQREKII
jgi:hypothetical protein